MREHIGASLAYHGITFELGEEKIETAGHVFTLLNLVKTGKRPGEGQIAEAMKKKS